MHTCIVASTKFLYFPDAPCTISRVFSTSKGVVTMPTGVSSGGRGFCVVTCRTSAHLLRCGRCGMLAVATPYL